MWSRERLICVFMGLFVLASSVLAEGVSEIETIDEKYDRAYIMYKRGDVTTPMTILQELADQGHAQSAQLLGYFQDQAGNFKYAIESYQRAVELGNGEAAYRLALMYLAGRTPDEKVDEKKYLDLIKLAARRKYPDAYLEIANGYESGKYGYKKSSTTAIKWVMLAVKNGSYTAMSRLSSAYKYGGVYGLKRNSKKSYHWQSKAEESRALVRKKQLEEFETKNKLFDEWRKKEGERVIENGAESMDGDKK